MPPKQVITNIRPLNKARNFLRLTPSIFHHRQKHTTTTFLQLVPKHLIIFLACLKVIWLSLLVMNVKVEINQLKLYMLLLNKYFKSFDSRTLQLLRKKKECNNPCMGTSKSNWYLDRRNPSTYAQKFLVGKPTQMQRM